LKSGYLLPENALGRTALKPVAEPASYLRRLAGWVT
jgi:hypothetical protein